MSSVSEYIKKFIAEYRRDFIVVAVLLIAYILIALYIGPMYGCLYMDTGRELYIPELVLKGKVMYKEVFMLYCPLAYYINAFLYAVFGVSLNNLLLFSYVNGFIVLSGFYLICRMFLKEFCSAAFVFLIMSYYIFGGLGSILSYILPYSYSFVYAVTFFVFSNLLFLYYMKTDNKKCLYVSAFLAGCIYACKFEFVLYVIPFFIVLLSKKTAWKDFFFSALLIITPGLLCIGALMFQGVTVNDFKEWFDFILKTMNSPEYIAFNIKRVALPWNFDIVGIMIKTLFFFILYIAFNSAFISLIPKNKFCKIFAVVCLPFYLMLNYNIVVNIWNYTENIFNWHILVLAVILLFKVFKLKILREQMLFFIAVSGILAMSRINFMPLEKCNYTIFFLTSLIPLWVWLIDFYNEKNPNDNRKYYVSVSLIVFSLFFLLRKEVMINWSFMDFKLPGTHLITEKRYGDSCLKSVEWLKNNTSKTDSVLVLPEGVIVNFLSGNPTNLKYFQLSPDHIPAFGEQKIVDDLNKDKPDYIFLTDTEFPAYELGKFCESYGLLLCDFTYEYYDKIEDIYSENGDGSAFTTSIYKLKENK